MLIEFVVRPICLYFVAIKCLNYCLVIPMKLNATDCFFFSIFELALSDVISKVY